MTTTFEDAKVGDKVWDMRIGWTTIISINDVSRYPIRTEAGKTYTTLGTCTIEDKFPVLFWDEVSITPPEKTMPTNTETNFYSHKVNLYIGNSDILCFSAYIAIDEPENYVIKNIKDFGEDPISKRLFDDVINGKLKRTFIDDMQPFEIVIDEGTALENIEKYKQLQEGGYFSSKMDLVPLARISYIGFRFDGSPYNLKYSIPRKAANKFEEIANDAIKIIEDETINDELEQDTIGLNKLIKIKESLRGYSIEEKAIGLALSWTESTWRFKVDHKSEAEGICGVVPRFWSDYLSFKGVDINSVSACIEIYNFYKEQHNGNRKEAIKAYKGIENNTYLIDKTLILRDKVLKILKDNK